MILDFRAWDKINKHMIIDSPISMGTIMGNYVGKKTDFNGKSLTERYEVTQFIGLHDKNGKKIFAGDIVCGPAGWIAEIVYDDAGFCFKWLSCQAIKKRMEEIEPIWGNVGELFEVIGNIYENPELRGVRP